MILMNKPIKSLRLSLFDYGILVALLSTFMTEPEVWSFQNGSLMKSKLVPKAQQLHQPLSFGNVHYPLSQFQYYTLLNSEKSNDNDIIEDDNDGWDNNEIMNETGYTSTGKAISNQQQVEWNNIKSKSNVVDRIDNNDDLFIPIFTLVSICGLLGAYGYEMIRLYLRGELYLPFLH